MHHIVFVLYNQFHFQRISGLFAFLCYRGLCCCKYRYAGHFLIFRFQFMGICSPKWDTQSCGRSVSTWQSTLHTDFHSGWTRYSSHQCGAGVPFPSFLWEVILVGFCVYDFLTGVKWDLSVVCICISLMAMEPECFFISLPAICIYPFDKFLLMSFIHFLMELFVCCLSIWSSQ